MTATLGHTSGLALAVGERPRPSLQPFVPRYVARLLAVLLAATTASVHAATFLSFTPDPARAGALSPEGCHTEPGLAQGFLTKSSADSPCHSGSPGIRTFTFNGYPISDETLFGYAAASFTTAPLHEPLHIPGALTLVVHYVAEEPGRLEFGTTRVYYALDVLSADGSELRLHSGEAFQIEDGGTFRHEVTLPMRVHTVAAGQRLRFILADNWPHRAGRLLFGGEYSDAGIILADGRDGGGGALPLALVATLTVVVMIRRRRGS